MSTKRGIYIAVLAQKLKGNLCRCHEPLNTKAHAHVVSLNLVLEDKILYFHRKLLHHVYFMFNHYCSFFQST